MHVSHYREHDLHGNRWAAIGRAIGVSARAARDKYRDVANRARKGTASCMAGGRHRSL